MSAKQPAQDSPGGSEGKATAYNAGDLSSIAGSGKSPGEGNGNPLQYSCLGNPMVRGAWWATGHKVEKELDMTEHLNNKFRRITSSCFLSLM